MFHSTRASRSTPEQLVRVWQHECLRVFYDRLTEQPARKWMVETLHEVGALASLVQRLDTRPAAHAAKARTIVQPCNSPV